MLINYVRATGSEMSRIEYNINHHITKAIFYYITTKSLLFILTSQFCKM